MADSSPFRTAAIDCPRCRTNQLSSGELRHCTKCKGAWIPTETLHEHVGTMQARVDPKLMWKIETKRLGLPCAVCHHTMETALLFDVPVDRCHSHGVWFDKNELAEVLKRSTTYIEPKPHVEGDSSVAWAAAEVGGQVALEVGVTAAEVGVEAGSGILEGVLDAIGGIFSAIDL